MRISWRRASLLLPGILLACSIDSNADNENNANTGGGCGIAADPSLTGSSVKDAPANSRDRTGAPGDPAPTGQSWKPVETDTCGRGGVSWILVDEICGDGEGNEDPDSLHAPMFRDGAVVNDHLFAVDATHLWSFDLDAAGTATRSSLVTGLGTPLAVDRRNAELVLAAGASGLVMVDVQSPAAPTRSRSIELAGKAFDVQVSGDTAFVAMGAAGIAEVNLASPAPAITRSWPIGGFSAGIAARGNYAFVAACGTFKVVDRTSGNVVAQTWVPNAVVGNRLVAPAKKVTLVGDVAFVAAGRYGAVAIDVAHPLQPVVLGNCTVPNDPSFYASGVRAHGDTLFVAGGEWGILPVGVSSPTSACSTLMAQASVPDPPAHPDVPCSSKPPWEIVAWEKVWAPPPPRKDPVQTLPLGDRVYGFGDARRIGVRAVDVRNALDPELPLLGRFDEPRALLAVAATPTRVIAAGPRGGVFAVGANGALTRTPTTADTALQASSAVTTLADGRWVALGPAGVTVEGKVAPIAVPEAGALAAVDGGKIAVSTKTAVHVIEVDTRDETSATFFQTAHLPLTLAADASGIYLAAPEWPAAVRMKGSTSNVIPGHTVFDAEDILDTSLWRRRLPRRHLLATARGLVEIAGVGPVVGLVLHGSSGLKKVALPAMTYAAAATDGDHVYLAAIDRGLYKSYLVSVDISGTSPVVRSVEAFTGAASGVAVAAGRVFVADADGALRAYTVASNGAAAFAGATEVQ